ncbi:MAG: response regulator [Burkholderiaceae bacterium]
MSTPFHILVVDDQAITRSIIVALLKKLGHSKVSEAENGQKALAILQSEEPTDSPINFIISDWRMPIMDGLALIRAIRACSDLQHLPVLLMTAYAETDDLGITLHTGADEYIDKQFLSTKFLEAAINSTMDKKSVASS